MTTKSIYSSWCKYYAILQHQMPTLLFYHIILQHLIYQISYNPILYIKIILILVKVIYYPLPHYHQQSNSNNNNNLHRRSIATTHNHRPPPQINHRPPISKTATKKKTQTNTTIKTRSTKISQPDQPKLKHQYQPKSHTHNPINLPPSTKISQPSTIKTTNHQKREIKIDEIGAAMTMAMMTTMMMWMIGVALPIPLAPPTVMTMATIRSEWPHP